MATVVDTDFETGDASGIASLGLSSTVQSAVVIRGAFSLKQTNNASVLRAGLSVTQSICRAYVIPVAYPGTNQDILVERLGGGTNRLHCELLSTGTLRLREGPGTTLGFAQVVSTTPISLGTTYCLEMAVDLAAGGIVRLWINGVLDIDATHPTDATASPTTSWIAGGLASPNQMIFDDIRLDTGTVAQIGPLPATPAAGAPTISGPGRVAGGGRRRERLARADKQTETPSRGRRYDAPKGRKELRRGGESPTGETSRQLASGPQRSEGMPTDGVVAEVTTRPAVAFDAAPLIATADALIAQRLVEQERIATRIAQQQAERVAAEAAAAAAADEDEAVAMILIAALQ